MHQYPTRQFPDMLGSFRPVLRHCNVCGRSQDNDPTIQLRKCGGCSRALYCSKRCQKKAWPFHKLTCRADATAAEDSELPASFSSLGYPSFPALARALQHFSEVHEWAFRSLAKASVLLNGGIEWSQNPPKKLVLTLAPTATTGTRERNPARTFRLTSYSFTQLSETLTYGPVQVMVEEEVPHQLEQKRKIMVELWRRHPDYLGLLPVTFLVDGLNIRFARFIPLFRPAHPPSPMPLLADDDGKKTVLQDIVSLTSGSINAGISFRTQEGSGTGGVMFPLPGQFNVSGPSASWSWTALFSRWEDYTRGVHQHLDDLFDTFTLPNVPGDTIVAFNLL